MVAEPQRRRSAPSYTRTMRWVLRRWLLAGGMRSLLAGYAGCPLVIGLSAAIAGHSIAGLLIVPGALMACFLAPLGLIAGMVGGVELGWGPWEGRLVYMGLLAGLVALAIAGRWLENRNPVPDGGDGTPRVPAARVVTAQLVPTVAWNRLIRPILGPILLVIAGAGLFLLGILGVGPA